MRENSAIDHVFSSDLSEEGIDRVRQGYEQIFEGQDYKDLAAIEREKTPSEKAVIELSNQVLNEYRTEFHLPPFSVPEKNIHIIPAHKWEAPQDKIGMYKISRQGIVIKEESSNLEFAATAFHEMTHMHSFASIEVRPPDLGDYRFGMETLSRPDWKRHFKPLNEAITSEITKRFILSHDQHPLFAEEWAETQRLHAADPDAESKDGKKLFDADTYYAGMRLHAGGTTGLYTNKFSYPTARAGLEMLIRDLVKRSSDKLEPEQLFRMFFKSMFDGKILAPAKQIERVYGQGSFRRIGEQATEETFAATIQSLVEAKQS